MQPYSFPPTISARDIQRGYKKVFDTVKKTKRPVVVMANNTPQAAIISVEMLEKYNQFIAQQYLWDAVEKIRMQNTDRDPDTILRDVTAEVEAVRQEMYERKKAKRSH